MADNEITTLDGVHTGRYVVTTQNGTTHTIDIDRKTLVRRPADPERKWDYAGIGLGRITSDGEVFRWTKMENASVGKCMMLENSYEWRVSSRVISIERADV